MPSDECPSPPRLPTRPRLRDPPRLSNGEDNQQLYRLVVANNARRATTSKATSKATSKTHRQLMEGLLVTNARLTWAYDQRGTPPTSNQVGIGHVLCLPPISRPRTATNEHKQHNHHTRREQAKPPKGGFVIVARGFIRRAGADDARAAYDALQHLP